MLCNGTFSTCHSTFVNVQGLTRSVTDVPQKDQNVWQKREAHKYAGKKNSVITEKEK